MNNRNELIDLIEDEFDFNGTFDITRNDLGRAAEKATDAILAAGYRKPHTITTVDELDALNPNSVLMWIDDAGLTHTVCAAVVQMSVIEMWPMDVLWTPEESSDER